MKTMKNTLYENEMEYVTRNDVKTKPNQLIIPDDVNVNKTQNFTFLRPLTMNQYPSGSIKL